MSDFANLVNPDRIRQAIRRLFSNQVDEILGELFQNAQRAGATAVTITTTDTTVVIHDNGHGLGHGAESFYALLKLAESDFADPSVAIQDPMGLGIHALLAHTEVTCATFRSNGLELTIETARWWEDPDYYTTWAERLVTVDDVPPGFTIMIAASNAFVSLVRTALVAAHTTFRDFSPAQGYDGWLTISLDGEAVDTTTPQHLMPGPAIITTTYEGNRLTIGFRASLYGCTYQIINWYGQLIISSQRHRFWSYLEVTSGRPVNPLAPSRRGLIHDDAYAALQQTIIDHIFQWTADPANRAAITPAWILGLTDVNRHRTLTETPYVVTAPWLHQEPGSIEDIMNIGYPELHTYDEHPLLLNDELRIPDEHPDSEWYTYGLTSFVPLLDLPHKVIVGDQSRLSIHTLWWEPGAPRADAFALPGKWGLGTHDSPPTTWHPVTCNTVYAFQMSHSWDVDYVDTLVVGCTDPIAFYQHDVWAAFRPDDHEEEALCRRSFEDSCVANIRVLMGACVPTQWSLDDVWHVLRKRQCSDARIETIAYHYDAQATRPSAMTVTQADGSATRITFFA